MTTGSFLDLKTQKVVDDLLTSLAENLLDGVALKEEFAVSF